MRTSVNLRNIDLPRIDEACEKYGRSHSELICNCLKKYFSSHPERLKTSLIARLVEYQPDGAGYSIVNIVFDLDVYNLGINFRVFSRLSVSMMVTIAIGLYLDQVIREIEGKEKVIHNYVDLLHEIRHNPKGSITGWIVMWNIFDINGLGRHRRLEKLPGK